MERIIGEGHVDLISMSRAFIRDPLLVLKFRDGEIQKSVDRGQVSIFHFQLE